MPRPTKDSQAREDETERDDVEAPQVDELEDDRTQSKNADEDEDEDEYDVEDDDVVQEIDLDELSAMEGPDA